MTIRSYILENAEHILLAHTPEKGSNKAPETLVEHSNLVMQYVDKLCSNNGLSGAIKRAITQLTISGDQLNEQAQQLVERWFNQAIYLHDLGKVNPVFQRGRMDNKAVIEIGNMSNASHSMLSSILYLHIHLPEIEQKVWSEDKRLDKVIRKVLRHILFTFAYTISRHHTYLNNLVDSDQSEQSNFEISLQEWCNCIAKHPSYVYYYQGKEDLLKEGLHPIKGIMRTMSSKGNNRIVDRHAEIPLYVLTKLLFSTMVACDFYATYSYDTGIYPEFRYFGEQYSLDPIIEAYQNSPNYCAVQNYQSNPDSAAIIPMNKLRSELFIEAQHHLLLNLQRQIFYLEAPTGSGKTFTSLNLALQLLKNEQGLNKLLYIFPYNALIEQTKQTLNEIFPTDLQSNYRMAVVNSVTPIVTDEEMSENGLNERELKTEYKAELLQRQMLQYPVTLTSHVNFFNYLFGIGRESNLALTHLCNSVVILDEIQSYSNKIWKEIIHFFQTYSEILNMKIIIMSATLPKLDLLMEESRTSICSLIFDRNKYFDHPVFRDRVKLHFELLEKGKMDHHQLLELVLGQLKQRKAEEKSARILIEFINKSSARGFYQCLPTDLDIPIFELTGDDSNIIRHEVLAQLGKDPVTKGFKLQEVIVVATQVIEAGVDIDMDIGYKDISILDSEEQFLGRINRSCLRVDCHAYFFYMDDTKKIYRNDVRTELDLRCATYQEMLQNKNFTDFYGLAMERLNERRKQENDGNWMYFMNEVRELRYEDIKTRMELISDKPYTLFIAHRLTYTDASGTYEYDGKEVWQQYKELLADKTLSYAERKIRLSQIQERLAYFTFNYGSRDKYKNQAPMHYDQRIGNMYYVADGERFMVLDPRTGMKKFNRSAYSEGI